MQLRFLGLRTVIYCFHSCLGTTIHFQFESFFLLCHSIDDRVQIYYLHQLILSLFELVLLIAENLYLVKQFFLSLSKHFKLLNSFYSTSSCACTILSALLFYKLMLSFSFTDRSRFRRCLFNLLRRSFSDWSLKDILLC